MNLRATFPINFRGDDLIADVKADWNETGRVEVQVTFTKDGEPHAVKDLTRAELAVLCRAASRSKRQ